MPTTVTPTHPGSFSSPTPRMLSDHRGWFMVEGIVLMVLGFAAIVVPPLATLAVTIFLGWLFVISGVAGLVMTFMQRHAPGVGWAVLSALVALLVGALLLWRPLAGVLSLTLVLAAYFIVDGVLSILFAIEHRGGLPRQWGWLLASGVVDLILAGIILAGFPGTAAWVPGLLVGIDMLVGGAALFAVAVAAGRTARV